MTRASRHSDLLTRVLPRAVVLFLAAVAVVLVFAAIRAEARPAPGIEELAESGLSGGRARAAADDERTAWRSRKMSSTARHRAKVLSIPDVQRWNPEPSRPVLEAGLAEVRIESLPHGIQYGCFVASKA